MSGLNKHKMALFPAFLSLDCGGGGGLTESVGGNTVDRIKGCYAVRWLNDILQTTRIGSSRDMFMTFG